MKEFVLIFLADLLTASGNSFSRMFFGFIRDQTGFFLTCYENIACVELLDFKDHSFKISIWGGQGSRAEKKLELGIAEEIFLSIIVEDFNNHKLFLKC